MSRVCIFGDSITWGSWDPAGGGWVGRLYEAGCNRVDHSDPEYGDYTAVYNCGISGDRVQDLLRRFEVEAIAREPAAIVLAIGINDVPREENPEGTPLVEFERDYQQLIELAKRHARDVVLITPTNVDESNGRYDYKNKDIAALVDVVKRCGEHHDIQVIDVFDVLTADDLKPDGLHPGTQGHTKLFELISPVIFSLPSLNGPN